MMNNNLLSTAKHGFISGRSTQTQQIHFLDHTTQLHDNNKQTEIVYLDFSKAFDTVSHGKLLHVLSHYQIDPTVIIWIKNYLSQRLQNTVVDDIMSNCEPVTSGVPQGSVLAPLLFIIYTEDLIRTINQEATNTTVFAYADDIKLISNDPNDIQLALDTVKAWIDKWQLRLNTNKSEHLTIRLMKQVTLTIRGEPIPKVTKVRDLGITITDNFKWKPYIAQIRSKANILSHSILRTFSSSNCWLLINLFKTYVRPLVEYNTCSWSPSLKGDIKDIESVQKMFTRKLCIRCNISFNSYDDRLNKLGMESLEVRRIKNDLVFLFKIVHNLVDIDFSSFFQLNSFSGHNLRRHSLHITRQLTPKTNTRSHFYSHRVIKYWNMLPNDIVCSDTLATFKLRLKKWNPPTI